MQTIWVRSGEKCRFTIAEVAGTDEIHVIDYIIWVRDVYVGNLKFCPVMHLWGIRLCPCVIVTQACLDTIWAMFHWRAPHTVRKD